MGGDARHYLFLLIIGFAGAASTSRAQPTEVKVGLIIHAASAVGKIATTTIPMALQDFYGAFPNSSARVKILQHDSGADAVAAASAALQLMTTQGARAILGPQSSIQSAFVADLATQAEVPVVSFSATSPSVSPTAARFFSRAARSDAAQVRAVAALAAHFGWRRVVPIYQEDDYGAALVPFLVDALASVRAEVPYRCALPAAASPDALAAELYRMDTDQTRVFLLHTRPNLARRVFAAAEEAGMTRQGYVWVITEGLTGLLGAVEPPQGVIGLAAYVPTTSRLRWVKKRWAHRYMRDHPDDELSHAVLGCYAVWAYDAAWAVASAAERLSAADLSSPTGLVNGMGGPTDISGLGKSASGENFLRAIRDTKFEGLGGWFDLVDGELVVPDYRVLNIIDNGKAREVGFWSPRYGLSRHVSRRSNIEGGELGPVIWPGESAVQPSGWVQPTSAGKLRVAVPGKISDDYYRSILHLDVDPTMNRTTAGGFVIDVFEAAVRLLPYALPFEYVKTEPQPYDNLILGVENGTFDAAVADLTITADRATHVDFTLPYVATEVAMVVPLRDQRSIKLSWFFFLKPLSYDLWLVTAAFFLFTGIVVWVIEHDGNEEFGASRQLTPSNQAGALVYFGFSTLVFAHREKLTSDLSRLVVAVWVLVVLILQSSYTASLTSMLTVPRVEPSIGDYGALLRGTAKVGIMNNSFMGEALVRESGLSPERIVRYPTRRSFQEALLNGSIGAVVNETPYFAMFLRAYGGSFAMTGQRNKTGGFGFAFPKGSPLATDVSQAILELTESDEIDKIERKWFGDPGAGGDGGSRFTSESLSFYTFRSLFLITGVISLVCCVAHAIFSAHADYRRQRQHLSSPPDPEAEAHTPSSAVDVVGSPHSAATYTTQMTLGSVDPPTVEIQPISSSGQEGVEAVAPAPHTDSSSGNQ